MQQYQSTSVALVLLRQAARHPFALVLLLWYSCISSGGMLLYIWRAHAASESICRVRLHGILLQWWVAMFSTYVSMPLLARVWDVLLFYFRYLVYLLS